MRRRKGRDAVRAPWIDPEDDGEGGLKEFFIVTVGTLLIAVFVVIAVAAIQAALKGTETPAALGGRPSHHYEGLGDLVLESHDEVFREDGTKRHVFVYQEKGDSGFYSDADGNSRVCVDGKDVTL
jgi:hypothetical protein